MPAQLTGPEMGELRDLLSDTLTRDRLSELLRYRLNKKIGAYVSPADDDPAAFAKVVDGINMEGEWLSLLREARNMRPNDPGLLAFAQKKDQGPQVLTGPKGTDAALIAGQQLELKIRAAQQTMDILTWRTRLGEIESRVCRIEMPETRAQGTGFLVAPNLVLTNYHVIEAAHKIDPQTNKPRADAQTIKLRFDFKVQANGVTVAPGKVYGLADQWLEDFSPYSPRDLEVDPKGDPENNELDYALLRVNGSPGNDPIGGDTNDPNKVARGWIKPLRDPYDFKTQRALFIVQHPDGKPMQVAIDSDSILSENAAKNRIRYTTTTFPGSSGSPCFSADWEWIALHHSGDPKYAKFGQTPTYNEGIPVAAILKRLADTGKSNLLATVS